MNKYAAEIALRLWDKSTAHRLFSLKHKIQDSTDWFIITRLT